ncbi:MAG: type II toxin-antitoxin system RelB/DinJ family antitoxin [Candidatus Altimarinota bacterium]
MKTVSLQTRIPKKMKDEAGKILKRLGLDFSTANRMFYAQIIATKGIPFEPKLHTHIPTQWHDLTEEEERKWNKQVAEASLGKLWNNPEDDVWDTFYQDIDSIR